MSQPTQIIFSCDESGAKGYSNLDEKYLGEVGVFAGILMPEEVAAANQLPFQDLITKYKPASGKLHIADLPDFKQEELRQDVYTVLRENELPCFWYAIHVAGFYQWYKQQTESLKEIHKVIEGSSVKRGSARESAESLHEFLFLGLYANLIAFMEEREKTDVLIEIRSDQIDAPIIKGFKKAACNLLNSEVTVSKATGFDTVSKSVIRGQISMHTEYPPELRIKVNVRELVFKTNCEDDGLVLAADVLANSLNYLFKNRPESELFKPLNLRESIRDHPLEKNLDTFNNWGATLPPFKFEK